jgi:predicted SprT family Zn-dependent metalloprotease
VNLVFKGIDDPELQHKITLAHRRFEKKLTAYTPGLDTLTVELTNRYRTSAGFADPNKWVISINYWLHRFDEAELLSTYGHELAHIYAYACFGFDIKAHGPEWARVMVDLGLTQDQRHVVSRKEMRFRKQHWKT